MRRQHRLHAKGNVHLIDPLGDIRATEARLSTVDETGDLTNGKVTNKAKTYRLEGEHLTKLLGQHYHVLDGFFTTCGCDTGTPDWSITAKEMDVHFGDEGVAHQAHFNILGIPVLYFPYATFPADASRHSGLLAPRIGESGLRGAQLVQPYYWAINRSSDATAALDVETSQRVGLLGEYRLINQVDDFLVVDGAFYDESLRSQSNRTSDIIDTQLADPHIPLDRYDVIGMVRQHITPNLVLYGDGMTVSDSLELREMNIWTLSRTVGAGISFPNSIGSLRNAQSDFGALYEYDQGYAKVQGTWNQDLIQPAQFALQTLPEILVSGRKDLFGGLAYTDYDIQGVDFYRSQGQDGLRLDINPRLTVPWRLSDYLYGWGTLGLRETIYDTSGDQVSIVPIGTEGRLFNNNLVLGPLLPGGLQTREMIYGNAGIASEFERIYDIDTKWVSKLKHTIEPFATYSYVPQVDQSDLPLFDETDRMEARSLISYGFTTRLYGKLPPRPPTQEQEATDASSEQEGETERSIISPFRAQTSSTGGSVVELARLTLLQAYDTDHAIAKGNSRFSDVDVTGTVFPTRIWSLGGQLGYSPQDNQIRYASGFMDFQPWWTNNVSKVYSGKAEEGSFLQISYNYIAPGPTATPGVNANFSQFLGVRAYYALFDRMGVFFAPSYDFTSHQLLSQEYGVRIKSPCDCWAFDTGLTKTVNPSETAVQFQLTLGGIGSVGQSPFGRNPFQIHTGVLPNYR